MKLDIIAKSKNDEFYTPRYAITPILKYVRNDSNVWCPFDTEESLFVKMLREKGCDVTSTHIWHGEDFFKLSPPPGCEYIISNPPYSTKGDVLERLFALNVPFAMLIGVVGLFESQKRYNLFKNNDFEIMYLNKRVAFFKDYSEQKPSLNPPFSSAYICKNVLPKQIIFEEIEKTG